MSGINSGTTEDLNLGYRNATGVSTASEVMDKLRELKNSFRG